MITSVKVANLAIGRGQRVLFRGLDLVLGAGEAVALVGRNGAGKTSLLRAVAGFIRPLEGEVCFEGVDGRLHADDARSSACHLVGHQDGLKSNRTAGEELVFQARWCGGSATTALEAAGRLGLTRLLELDVRVLSAGQRRRLALARLIGSPRPLWLLDEPLAPLDTASRALFGSLMAEHLGAGGLILAAVHDPLPIPVRLVEVGG